MSNILSFNKQENEKFLLNDNNNYYIQGFRDAGKVGGSIAAFNISLDNFYSSLLLNKDSKKENVDRVNAEIEISKEKIINKIEVHKKEIERLNERELPVAEDTLRTAVENLNEFKKDPSKFVRYEKDNLFYWFYGTLSLFLAIFLYFFYTSVVYSAVFRDITITKFTIYDSIFYPKAIEEAYLKGFSAFMIVIFAPFIFLSLGLLIEHKKTQKNTLFKYAWVILAAFTFIVDAILAYHISERIYNSKAINTYGNIKPFTIIDAVTDLNFWIIIALGFCVYLVFGKIFSLFNEQRMNKNKFEQVEKNLIEEAAIAEKNVNDIKAKINELETEIYQLEIQTTEIHKEYDKVFYSPFELRKILSEYALGWINFLNNGNYGEDEIRKINITLNDFYSQKGIA